MQFKSLNLSGFPVKTFHMLQQKRELDSKKELIKKMVNAKAKEGL